MTEILAVQFSPKTGDKKYNLNKVAEYIDSNSHNRLDLVVLSEFFSTGISHDAFVQMAEDEFGGETIKFLSELAIKYHTNIICGTVIEKCEDKYYNTTFVLNREGQIVGKYRKIHLYNYMGGKEGELITAGDKTVVVDLDFGKIGLAICFDIRYPQMFRELAQKGAEIIVLPTAWIIPKEVFENEQTRNYARDMWIAMNRTRAYDNMVYTVICDNTGRVDSDFSTLGCSMIISPMAEVLADAKFEQTAIYSQVDLGIVKLLKSQYPITSID